MSNLLARFLRGRRDEDERLRAMIPLIEAMADGAILTDLRGAVVAANQAAIELSKDGDLGEVGAVALQEAAGAAAAGARIHDRALEVPNRRALRLCAAPVVEHGRTVGALVTVRRLDAALPCPVALKGDDVAEHHCAGGYSVSEDPVPLLLVDPELGTILGGNAAAAEFVSDGETDLRGMSLSGIDADGELTRAVSTGMPRGPAPVRIRARGGIASASATARPIDRDGTRLLLVHLDRRCGSGGWPSHEDGGRIAAAVNHSLRTPLTSIIGFAQMIRDGSRGDLPQPYRDFAAEIHSGGMRLMSMVEDVMKLIRLSSGNHTVQAGSTDPREIVDERMELVRGAARLKGVRLIASGMRDAPLVSIDRKAMIRIVDHLLSNAVRFAPSGGRIAVVAEERDGMVLLTVEDDGPGIAETEAARLGRPFQVGDDALARGDAGLGLGLAIVRGIAEAHDGALVIGRSPEGGASITVGLPRAEP